MVQSVGIELDPKRKHPLHRQIFDEVVARIDARAFPPGFKLPPTRVLARELGTHRNTVARAYAELEAAGFVSSAVGRGTFVETLPGAAAGARPEPVPGAQALTIAWPALLSRAARSQSGGLAERRARSDPKAIDLARMQPSADLLPDELLRRCITHTLSELGPTALNYAPAEGAPRLREQIARDLVGRGVPARADELLVTCGSQQALDLIARALLDPGDTLLVEPTTYAGAIELFSLAGARLLPVPVDAGGPDPGALERFSRSEVKALYLMPNAHNPTGVTLPVERRRALVAWSRASGIPIIEDDYAAGLCLDEREPLPHLRALDGEVIHVSTYSKRLAPALRVGYVLAPERLRASLARLKRVVDLGTSLAMQHALAEFLERGYLRAHAGRVRQAYRARRDALDAALHKAMPSEVRWQLPSHGLVLWLRLPAGVDPQRVADEAERGGVLVSPSTLWSVGGSVEPALRLSFCAEPEPRLADGARRLGKALKLVLAERAAKPREVEAVDGTQAVI